MANMSVKDGFIGRILGGADKYTDKQVAQTIDLFLEHGVKRGARAIHIEPQTNHVAIRYRIHGGLQGMHKVPLGALEALTTQLKERAGLHTAITTPQEGTYTATIDGRPVEVRTATMPVIGGEKIVLHLTEQLATIPSLEALGFWGEGLRELRLALGRTHGLLVVASPKHAGRIETLHSMTVLAATPHLSVATLEQTITQRLPGVMQTTITNASAAAIGDQLKAVLAADPNIVMIDRLPDRTTLDTALQAAANGHLVLGGLFAENAVRALLHLAALSSEPFLLAAAAKLAVSERRVRRLCTACRERYAPTKEQVVRLEKAFGMTNAAIRQHVHKLEEQAAADGIGGEPFLSSTASHVTHLWRASENGCEHCRHSGYQGTVSLVEVLSVNEPLHRLILEKATAGELQTAAVKDGFVPLALDGLIKALRGETTIVEVLQATAHL